MIKINDQEFDPQIVIDAMKASEYNVRSKDQETEFITNTQKLAIESTRQEEGDKFKKQFASDWRAKFESTETELTELGFKKNIKDDGSFEGGDEMALRVARTLHENAKELQAQVNQLKEKGGDELLKGQIKTLEKSIIEMNQNHDSKIMEMNQNYLNTQISGEQDKFIAQLRFKEGMDDATIEGLKQSAKILLSSQYKEVKVIDGELRLIGNDGEVMINKQTAKPISFSDILGELPTVKPFLHTEHESNGGTGTKKPTTKTSSGKNVSFPSGATSKNEVTDFLMKQGLNDEERTKVLVEHKDAWNALPFQ